VVLGAEPKLNKKKKKKKVKEFLRPSKLRARRKYSQKNPEGKFNS
jgi:hypothetical protein